MPIRPVTRPSALAAATARSLARLGAFRAALILALASGALGAALAGVDLGRPRRLTDNTLLASQTLLLHAAAWLLAYQLTRDDRRLGLALLSAPLGPTGHLAGRFLGLCLTLAGLLLVLLAMDGVLLILLGGAPVWPVLAQLGLAALSAALAAALALLLMQVLPPAGGLLLAVLAWAAGHGLDEALVLAREQGGPVLIVAVEAAYRLLPNFSFFDVGVAAAGGASPWRWLFPLPYAPGYAALLILLAGRLARRRPFPER